MFNVIHVLRNPSRTSVLCGILFVLSSSLWCKIIKQILNIDHYTIYFTLTKLNIQLTPSHTDFPRK